MSAEPNRAGPGSYRVALRWGDLDALGHVNQAVYHELLEEARTVMLASLLRDAKQSFVLARVELNYRREIVVGRELRPEERFADVVLEVEAVGRSSVTLAQRIFRSDGELAAEGSSVLVAWNGDERTSRPLTERELGELAKLRSASAAKRSQA